VDSPAIVPGNKGMNMAKTTYEGVGLESPVPNNRRESERAMNALNAHHRAARHDVKVGDVGRDYFLHQVTVVEVDERTVTLRDACGNLYRRVRAHWHGMMMASAEEITAHFMAEHDDGSVDESKRAYALDRMKARPEIVIEVAKIIGERKMAGSANDYEYAVEILADLLTR
jgi:hypothetical protein